MNVYTDIENNKNYQQKASIIIICSSLLTLCLYIIPFLHFIAYPFLLISTLVHEMSHGIGAILVGGHFDHFQMFFDGSGAASIKGHFGRLSTAFIAASGLLGPSIMAACLISFIPSKKKSRGILGVLGLILCISLVLVVRNVFALIFIGILIFLCFFFALGKGKNYAQSWVGFLAMQLALSVFSRSDYLFTKTAQTSLGPMPSDVEQIAQALFLPYWFWGALIGFFSVAVLFYSAKSIYKN